MSDRWGHHASSSSIAPRSAAPVRANGRRRLRAGAALALVIGTAAGVAVDTEGDGTVLASPSSLDGTTPADAAASCWEIKQNHPNSTDGLYWLRTELLERPEQYHCDMTTDGGGWVLIARGREGWTFRDYGQSTPQAIRETVDGPGAFSPGALGTETIDGLLGGGDVRDLPDGVRLRRALDKTGTTWQEVRWRFLDLTSWSWA
ncbi:MAG: fibrinogen-like YCDxxxxGGGW domain-containing protein, partial [Actinomycetota bacterium]